MITDKMLLKLLNCDRIECSFCISHSLCYSNKTTIALLCEALLEERKRCVWEQAPDCATKAKVGFTNARGAEVGCIILHQREAIKSRAEIAAEQLIHDWHSKDIATDEALKNRIVELLESYSKE